MPSSCHFHASTVGGSPSLWDGIWEIAGSKKEATAPPTFASGAAASTSTSAAAAAAQDHAASAAHTAQHITPSRPVLGRWQQIMVLKRESMTESNGAAGTGVDGNKAGAAPQSLAARLAGLFYAAYLRIAHDVRSMQPCVLLGISHSMHILDDGVLEVLVTGAAHPVQHPVLQVLQSPRLPLQLQLPMTPLGATCTGATRERGRSGSASLRGGLEGSRYTIVESCKL